MTIRNVPLLQKALEHVDAHPEEWNQGSWGHFTEETACGTACCLAGHIALIDGWKPVRRGFNDETWDGVIKDGVRAETEDAAIVALGAGPDDFFVRTDREFPEYLFGAGHNRVELWRLANRMTGGQLNLPADIEP